MIFVSNPGTHPEMMRLAGGLIKAGHEVRYVTSSSWASDSLLQRLARVPAVSRTPIGRDLQRRALPLPLESKYVTGSSRGHEIVVQLARRFRTCNVKNAIRRRNVHFQKKLNVQLKDAGGSDVLVAQYTASKRIFEQAPPSVFKILNYPIVHHHWLMKHMNLEAEANPLWAPLLQGHDFTPDELASLDAEIAMADAIFVPSSFTAATFMEFGIPAEKLRVIPLGCSARELVTSQQSPNGSFTKTSIERSGLKLLFAGQATQRKGLGYLVEAVNQIPFTQLTVVGPITPEGRTLLARFQRVRHVPSVPRRQLYDLMNEADLLVLPSLAEGFGLVALEAMANGTPCLLSERTFGPDLIVDGENGYLLEKVSTKSIVDALLKITLEREKLACVGAKAAATAKLYSWGRYSDAVAQEIEELSGISRHG